MIPPSKINDDQSVSMISNINVKSNGKIIASGSPDEVISDKAARRQYFGDEFYIK